jgi:8-oxo-dGTP pyrophosphatase MutT (NUDIX family)
MSVLSGVLEQHGHYFTDRQQFLSLIRDKLDRHQLKTYKYADVPYREAAVLIPLFYKDDEAHLLFTKRTDKVEHHKGQISFPGGMVDDQDIDLRHTALRETHEEMGIQAADIKILGQTDRFLTNTHFLVTPFVGYFEYPYLFKINPDEIEKVLYVPLRHLLDPQIFRTEEWVREGVRWNLHFYDFQGENIWGVTGFLLSNFFSIIFDLPLMNMALTLE